jgi:hypothetical protein
LCRRTAAQLTSLRPQFEAAGVKLTVLSGTENGAADFVREVWKGGELYIDEHEQFKKAIHGGNTVSAISMALLNPWLLRTMLSLGRQLGAYNGDVSDKKTQVLGGTMLIKNGKAIFVHKETSSFNSGDANDLLFAALGGNSAPTPAPTLIASEVVCDGDVCGRPPKRST